MRQCDRTRWPAGSVQPERPCDSRSSGNCRIHPSEQRKVWNPCSREPAAGPARQPRRCDDELVCQVEARWKSVENLPGDGDEDASTPRGCDEHLQSPQPGNGGAIGANPNLGFTDNFGQFTT